ncbi:NADPH-dependent FMN reductase [Francisella salina]|uniref:Reductase n=1 Tax=Francisella salina TaxID=573569 RepID=A0ABN3ZM40_FRAST|nr:NAD(P)H-dependent oxidoreductase [Francisella salina]AEI35235.1 putative reductase [Francisella salina]
MHFLIFLGSVRQSTPPSPIRLGHRVALACEKYFIVNTTHSVEVVDPLDFELERIFKPHFAYHKNKVPQNLDLLAQKIKNADGYVMISPEYNHTISPALTNLLNHFGSSLFSYKPSAIVTYSAGQWGGARAAVSMRTFLSELGCLPVSAMIHIPKAHEVFLENGDLINNHESWQNYMGRSFLQLEWWAQATKELKQKLDPEKLTPSMKKDPSQRNAPQ